MTEASRKIDALLAEHLFEWTWLTCLGFVWFGPKETVGEKREYGTVRLADDTALIEGTREDDWWVRDEPESPSDPVVPHYSTTGDGMLMVLAKIGRCTIRKYQERQDLYLGIHPRKLTEWITRYKVSIWHEGKRYVATADTMAMAVALVALKALGFDADAEEGSGAQEATP